MVAWLRGRVVVPHLGGRPTAQSPFELRGASMSRRPILVFACALALALLGSTPAGAAAQSASTSESSSPIADQGSSLHYRSEITSITPKVKGLSIEVLEFADRD